MALLSVLVRENGGGFAIYHRKALNASVWGNYFHFHCELLSLFQFCYWGCAKRGLGKFSFSFSFHIPYCSFEVIFGAAGRDRWWVSRAIEPVLFHCSYYPILGKGAVGDMPVYSMTLLTLISHFLSLLSFGNVFFVNSVSDRFLLSFFFSLVYFLYFFSLVIASLFAASGWGTFDFSHFPSSLVFYRMSLLTISILCTCNRLRACICCCRSCFITQLCVSCAVFVFKLVFLSMWLLTLNGCSYHLWQRLCDVCWFRSFCVFDSISFACFDINLEGIGCLV